MARTVLAICVVAVAGLASGGAPAQGGRYHITPREKSACRGDATRFCYYTFPNERRLLVCMKQHRAQLGDQCRRVFEKGVARRGL